MIVPLQEARLQSKIKQKQPGILQAKQASGVKKKIVKFHKMCCRHMLGVIKV